MILLIARFWSCSFYCVDLCIIYCPEFGQAATKVGKWSQFYHKTRLLMLSHFCPLVAPKTTNLRESSYIIYLYHRQWWAQIENIQYLSEHSGYFRSSAKIEETIIVGIRIENELINLCNMCYDSNRSNMWIEAFMYEYKSRQV